MSRRAALGAKSSLVVAHGGETVYTGRIEVLVKSQVVAYKRTPFLLLFTSGSSSARCATRASPESRRLAEFGTERPGLSALFCAHTGAIGREGLGPSLDNGLEVHE